MRISKLQKYMLLQCYLPKPHKVERRVFCVFYNNEQNKLSRKAMIDSITGNLDSLIEKGLIIAFGEITKSKNFIKEVKLTSLGRQAAKRLLGEQKKLPLKIQNPNLR